VAVGTYNIILTVTGPGGSSSVTRKITVEDPVVQPPKAAFASDKTTGDTPLLVQFVNQSTGKITSYNWDFGDTETSIEPNPTHTYTKAGTYKVILTAIGSGGQSTAQATITVNQKPDAPIAAFKPDTSSGNIPLTVKFTNQSKGQITAYNWDFGDGSASSADPNPSHTYQKAGTYTITLNVDGPGGKSSAQAAISAVQPVAPPVAAFVQDKNSGSAPLTVQFTNQSTGESLTFNWNFGDSSPASTDANPSHVFKAPGTYTVVLIVKNSGGLSQKQGQITVSNQVVPPIAVFSANPTTGNSPLTVQFTNQSTGDITAHNWNFGDGSAPSTDPNPSHVFTNPGVYDVTLIVSGPGGSSQPATTKITVNAPPAAPPVAVFTPNILNGDAPLTVQFTNQSTGDITAHNWNFGDGSAPSTDPNPSHIFTNPGAYDVTLIVSGPGGSSQPATTKITVNAPSAPPPPSITHPIAFTSDRDGNNEIYILNTDTTQINLTNNPANDTSSAWSPDGSKIAFVSDREGGKKQIFVMDANGGNTIRISDTTANDTSPTWSPDGSKIAFVSDRGGKKRVFVMNAGDGANPTDLTQNDSNDTSPTWSPDGSKIAFVSDRGGKNQIFVMGADGSNQTDITKQPSNDTSPTWSPDGSKIAFVSDRGGKNQIYIMSPDGADQVNVTLKNSTDSEPHWKPK
jgi:PKD repeat protein